jgi:hypothetical protein
MDTISDLWKEKRSVVCFLRQFGCRFCKQQIAGLDKLYDGLKEQQIALLVVGLGTPEEANSFRKLTGFHGEIYVSTHPREDEPRLYKQFGLVNSLRTLKPAEGEEGFGPFGLRKEVYLAGQKAIEEGFTDSTPDQWTGSTKQVGGVFVMGPGNSCDFAHRSAFAGDHADLAEVLTAATGMRPDGGDFMYPSTQLWSERLQLDKIMLPSPQARLKRYLGVETKVGRTATFVSAACVAILSTALVLPGVPHLQIATMVIAVVVAAVCFWWQSSNDSREESTSKDEKKKDVDIVLYTPSSIDEIAVKAGAMECDCSFIAQTDMVSIVAQVNKANGTESATQPSASTTVPTLSPAAVCPFAPTELAEYQRATCYFREFLAKGHPQLGRRGPTCPFVPLALKKNSLYMGVVRAPAAGKCMRHDTNDTEGAVDGRVTTAQQVKRVARRFTDRFFELEPTTGKLAVYKVRFMRVQGCVSCVYKVRVKAPLPPSPTYSHIDPYFTLHTNAANERLPFCLCSLCSSFSPTCRLTVLTSSSTQYRRS